MILASLIETTTLIKVGQFALALSILVFFHELGHYIFARCSGIKVNRFYLFFNYKFSLFKYFPSKGKIELISWGNSPDGEHDGSDEGKRRCLLSISVGKKFKAFNGDKPTWAATLYGLGWIPLGGYCDIDGMADETTSAAELEKQEPKPWEFRTKPSWQRLLVMAGGVLFNLILAVIIFAGIAWAWGEKYVPFENAACGYDYAQVALDAGFRNGDIPLLADGQKLDIAAPNVYMKMVEADRISVLRGSDTVQIDIPENFALKFNKDDHFMALRVPVYIDKLVGGQPAEKAGLEIGDRIIAVGDSLTPTYTELTPALLAYAGQETTVTVDRDGKEISLPVTPTAEGKLGFNLRSPFDIFETKVVEYSFFEAIPRGASTAWAKITAYVTSLKYLFTKEGIQQVGGLGTMGGMFAPTWDWLSFWELTGLLSIILAVMNILPIPMLDGGHILFLLAEMISRRKIPVKFIEIANWCGFWFLVLLMLYANGMDIVRAIGY